MCGRFTQKTPRKSLAREFQVAEVPEMEPRYNIAPAQKIIGISQKSGEREARAFKWGLVPSWAKDTSMGARLINARSETVGEKPAFREAFKRRRCIIPADGFYEWQRSAGRKQPYYFSMPEGRPFRFAGLRESWKGHQGEVLESCTILTTEANESVRVAHDRMPVILHASDYDLWLDEDLRKVEDIKELLRPYPASEMISYPVGLLVNNVRSEGSELIEPLKSNH